MEVLAWEAISRAVWDQQMVGPSDLQAAQARCRLSQCQIGELLPGVQTLTPVKGWGLC